jgi:hypothetical protein
VFLLLLLRVVQELRSLGQRALLSFRKPHIASAFPIGT